MRHSRTYQTIQLKTVEQGRQKQVFVAAMMVYGFSMLLPAIVVDDFNGQKSYFGIEAFLTGSIIILGGGLFEWCIWLANPLFLFALFVAKKGSVLALITNVTAIILAVSFLSFSHLLTSSSGNEAEIDHLSYGYFAWMLSIGILAYGHVLSRSAGDVRGRNGA
jgi:hypothetical protein